MTITTETLVALAPAAALLVAGLVVTVRPKLKRAWKTLMSSKQRVETLKEVISHLAFYGSPIAGFFGIQGHSPWTLIATLCWFFGLMWLSFHLAHCIEKIEHHDPD